VCLNELVVPIYQLLAGDYGILHRQSVLFLYMILGRSNVFNASGTNAASIAPGMLADCVVQSIYTSYVSSASAGSRQLYIDVLNGATVLYRGISLLTQAATNTYTYNALPGVPNETHTSWAQISLPFEFVLKTGWTIKVYDFANIDAVGDTITTNMLYRALG
jgi:hypothetical protein